MTHIQSLSQEIGSEDKGLGLFGFDLPSAEETDFLWLEEKQEEELYGIFLHHVSGQARVFRMYLRRWLCLGSRPKTFVLQGRHTRFVGDSALHRSSCGAPLFVGGKAEEVVSPSATSTEFDSI